MDACVLVDVSPSMSGWLPFVSTAVRALSRRMPLDARIAVVRYWDLTVEALVDFSSDQRAISHGLQDLREGSVADARCGPASSQHLALSRVLSPTGLRWRPAEGRSRSGGVVFHFTNAMPRFRAASTIDVTLLEAERELVTDATGRPPDWIEIGRSYARSGVVVQPFVFKSAHFGASVCWHAVMASLTCSDGVAIASKNVKDIENRMACMMDGRRPRAGAWARLSGEAAERLTETSCEENAGSLLTDTGSVRIDGPDNDARVAVHSSFVGLARSDATSRRFRPSLPEFEIELRESHAWLRKEIESILSSVPAGDDEAFDAISASTLRESCVEFLESECACDCELTEMFSAMAMLAFGPAICAPLTSDSSGGQKSFNYQSGFGVIVKAVRPGYQTSYGWFLEYLNSKKKASDWRNSTLSDLRDGVDDLVLRSGGQITGVLPIIADDSDLASRIYEAMVKTPWMNAVAWHSVCRHVMYPPHACVGLLGASLWAGCLDSAVQDSTLSRIARSLSFFREPGANRTSRPELSRVVVRAVFDKSESGFDPIELFRAGTEHAVRTSSRFTSSVKVYGDVVKAVFRLRRTLGLAPIPNEFDFIATAYPLSASVASAISRAVTSKCDDGDRSYPGEKCLPQMGTKRFNRALICALHCARRLKGLPMTGNTLETFCVSKDDIASACADARANIGRALIQRHGNAYFRFGDDGEWLAVRLGNGMQRYPENRGGRVVHVWIDQRTSSATSAAFLSSGQSTL